MNNNQSGIPLFKGKCPTFNGDYVEVNTDPGWFCGDNIVGFPAIKEYVKWEMREMGFPEEML